MAGPGAIITAMLMEGAVKQRMFSALLAGIIATIIIILAAGIGPKLLGSLNLNIIKTFGAISIGIIALMVFGIKIPSNVPLITMALGIIGGIILR
jgi:small neutral amino acid transporter SnatA (MarC family)